MKNIPVILILLCLTTAAGSVQADIYRMDRDDETITFTDSPQDKRYQLVMKEQRTGMAKTGKRKQVDPLKNQEPMATGLSTTAGQISRNLPIQGRITSPLGMRNDPIDGKLRHHNGMDIAAPSGTPVKPVAPGTVVFSGWKPGYGNTVILDHNDGMTTVYAHHASNGVVAGAVVDSDTVIAHSGSTGRSTGPHLHFEAWRNGLNITADFMPDSMAAHQAGSLASAPINRYLQADGTIIFTNLR